jgi:hypothetical protein
MATTDQHLSRAGRASSVAVAGRHRGQDTLAEVITLRPARPARAGLIGALINLARVVASPRAQATSVRSTPHPPPSPAARFLTPPRVPHDAA